jgi:hypothetical protein
VVDEWVRSPLIVSEVSCGPDDEEVVALSMHARSQAWVLNDRFGFLCGINSEVRGARPLTLLFQSSVSRCRNTLPRL